MEASKPYTDNFDTNTPISVILAQDYSSRLPSAKLHRFSIAPMMDITNVHFRLLVRLLTRHSTLWTEMIHANSLLHDDRDAVLRFNPIEHPVVLQLGGSDAQALARAAQISELSGYDEVNVNCGCPSERVQSGCFGAVLMKDPHKVAMCVKKMAEKLKIPVHVKCRIGVDDDDSYEFVRNFVEVVYKEGGCTNFIIHSRKCLLNGLSPLQNRTVPPLKYEVVKQLKKDFPDLQFSINGGIKTYEEIEGFLDPKHGLTGVMVGRLAYENPWILSDIDRRIYGLSNPGFSRKEVLKIWGKYCDRELEMNDKIAWPSLTKPIMSLFYNERNSAIYRRVLSDQKLIKTCKRFSDLIDIAIEEFEKLNPDAMNQKPPAIESETPNDCLKDQLQKVLEPA